jgi:hypothetical protein
MTAVIPEIVVAVRKLAAMCSSPAITNPQMTRTFTTLTPEG